MGNECCCLRDQITRLERHSEILTSESHLQKQKGQPELYNTLQTTEPNDVKVNFSMIRHHVATPLRKTPFHNIDDLREFQGSSSIDESVLSNHENYPNHYNKLYGIFDNSDPLENSVGLRRQPPIKLVNDTIYYGE